MGLGPLFNFGLVLFLHVLFNNTSTAQQRRNADRGVVSPSLRVSAFLNCMSYEVAEVIKQISKEKGIDSQVLMEAIESALISAYKKSVGAVQNAWVWVDQEEGEIELYAKKEVVQEVQDSRKEISLEEAKVIEAEAQLEDEVDVKITPQNFGRIAVQTAKQVIIQRVKEAERDSVYEEFKSKENDILNGVVQRYEGGNVIIDFGRCEAILPRSEQTPGERYNRDERIRIFILKVEKTTKGPLLVVSRTHPDLLKKLFEMEVPEISEGIVEVKGVAREAGRRSKIAVASKSDNVDPVGACVGVRGVRVQAVVRELGNEKIDIVRWSEDPVLYVSNSLNPAEITEILLDQEGRRMKVVVEDRHLALAIGKGGQNVRLAAKLTGWMIDIMSVSEYEVKRQELIEEVSRTLDAGPEQAEGGPESYEDFSVEDLPGIGKATADKLGAGGFDNIKDIANASVEQLSQVEGVGAKTANKIYEAAVEFMSQYPLEEEDDGLEADSEQAEGGPEGYEDFSVEDLPGIGKATADKLGAGGFDNIKDIANASVEQLSQVEGVGAKTANKIYEAAIEFMSQYTLVEE